MQGLQPMGDRYKYKIDDICVVRNIFSKMWNNILMHEFQRIFTLAPRLSALGGTQLGWRTAAKQNWSICYRGHKSTTQIPLMVNILLF